LLSALLHPPPSKQGGAVEVKLRGSILSAVGKLANIVTLRVFALAFVCYSVVGASISTWLAYFLYHRFRMSLTAAGFSANFYLELPTSAGNLAGGVLGDYFATRGPGGRLLTQAGSLTLAAPLFLAVGRTGSVSGVGASLALLGILRGAWSPNVMPVICQLVPQDLRATTYGVLNCLGNACGGVATVAAARLMTENSDLSGAFIAFALFYWLAAALLAVAARRLKKETPGDGNS
jgi:hypothetical protein